MGKDCVGTLVVGVQNMCLCLGEVDAHNLIYYVQSIYCMTRLDILFIVLVANVVQWITTFFWPFSFLNHSYFILFLSTQSSGLLSENNKPKNLFPINVKVMSRYV